MTVEPGNLQAMLATQFKDYELGKRRFDQFKPFIGQSIFSSDGAFWEHSRAMFRPQFARDNINDLEVTGRATSVLMEALGDTDSNGWTPGEDVMPLLYNFTLDVRSTNASMLSDRLLMGSIPKFRQRVTSFSAKALIHSRINWRSNAATSSRTRIDYSIKRTRRDFPIASLPSTSVSSSGFDCNDSTSSQMAYPYVEL